nr:MAG TPA: hypothetical protein [Caudoviricetes sp.]
MLYIFSSTDSSFFTRYHLQEKKLHGILKMQNLISMSLAMLFLQMSVAKRAELLGTVRLF